MNVETETQKCKKNEHGSVIAVHNTPTAQLGYKNMLIK